MLTPSKTSHQPNLFATDLLWQLDPTDPLLQLASVVPWHKFDEAFSVHYKKGTGASGNSPAGILIWELPQPCLFEHYQRMDKCCSNNPKTATSSIHCMSRKCTAWLKGKITNSTNTAAKPPLPALRKAV
ncbi:hypothetical protein ABF86_10180 [Nitrosomonas sp. GH22]|nr:hypothetical protein [Nitrosomonas sp. GH22]